MAPALRRRVQGLIRAAVMQIDKLQGPGRKQIGDAITEQSRSLASATGLEITIPERGALILNQP